MKLLYVITEYPPHFGGGLGTFYGQFLPTIVELGHSVTVLVANPYGDEFEDFSDQGVTVTSLPNAALKAQLPNFEHYAGMPYIQRSLATAWAAWQFVQGSQTFDFDIVETTDWGLLFAPWVIADEAPPSVIQLHASMGQINAFDPILGQQMQGTMARFIEAGCFAIADAIQANSLSNARYWTELIGRPVDYLPPPLNLTEENLETQEPCHAGVIVGRIQYWKGPEVLCKALELRAKNLAQKTPKMLWIGRDVAFQQSNRTMSDYLEKHYPSLWHKQVQCLGPLPVPETRQYQRGADFIVVPSIWDVFSYSCVEGMAYGKVVLCSEGAGAVDLIEQGVNGIRFKGNDPQALADALDQCLGLSPTQKTQMGQAAKETVLPLLNPTTVAQQRLEAYAQIIHRGRSQIKANAWLKDAIAPRAPLGNALSFLDDLPFKDLVKHCLRRGFQKLQPPGKHRQ